MKIEVRNDCINTYNLNIFNDGLKVSYKNGVHHNIDRPAFEWGSGNETWKFEGELHRKYGPAVEFSGGIKSWYFGDARYNQKEFMEKFL